MAVVLRAALLAGCLIEVFALHRPFVAALGWSMLAVTQALRLWFMRTLGPQWNPRVIVVPGAARVTVGPYRWIAHPNYVVVAIECAALPMVHTAWLIALAFAARNCVLLRTRIKVEHTALASLS